MFDLSNLDNVQVDHMLRDTRYRVLRPFADHSGATHAPGDEFLYRGAHVNMVAKRLTLRVTLGGVESEWLFLYESGDSPRPGNLKLYFEELQIEAPPRPVSLPDAPPPTIAPQAPLPAAPPTPAAPAPAQAPAPTAAPNFDELYAAALAGDFERAHALLKAIDRSDVLGEHHEEKLGSWLLKSTHTAARANFAAGQWFARQALDCWQSWAAGSTSGGEGAARSYEVSRIRKELAGYL